MLDHALTLALLLASIPAHTEGPDPPTSLAHVTVPPRPCGIAPRRQPARGAGAAAACPKLPRAGLSATDAFRIALGWTRKLRPAAGQQSEVTVRVYDAVGIARPDALRALDAAARILRSAELRTVWRQCGDRIPDTSVCAVPPAPGELIVRLTRATPATPPSLLGFSYVPGIVGTVLVDRVSEMADRSGTRLDALLGATLAHELAHLLMGAPSHAGRGLMRASWADEDVRRADARAFALTPADRQRLIESLRARSDPQN